MEDENFVDFCGRTHGRWSFLEFGLGTYRDEQVASFVK